MREQHTLERVQHRRSRTEAEQLGRSIRVQWSGAARVLPETWSSFGDAGFLAEETAAGAGYRWPPASELAYRHSINNCWLCTRNDLAVDGRRCTNCSGLRSIRSGPGGGLARQLRPLFLWSVPARRRAWLHQHSYKLVMISKGCPPLHSLTAQ
jgi:hypothetical protein